MTKAFDEQFAQGQDSIRFGREVPADDVNIAYVHALLEAGENVELSIYLPAFSPTTGRPKARVSDVSRHGSQAEARGFHG